MNISASAFPGSGARKFIFPVLLIAALLGVLALRVSTPNQALAQTCGKTDSYVAVWEVQGSGPTSPLIGQRLNSVRGVVTADFQQGTGGPFELWGFFIQAHEPDCDVTTSDGVFVYTGSNPKPVTVGDLVEISRGTVDEFQGPGSFTWDDTRTEFECFSGCSVSALQADYGLPAPEEYIPPIDDTAAAAYNEAREGMLVQVSEAGMAISPANAFNEFVMLRGTGVDRLHRDDPGHGQRIMVDADGVSAANCGQDGLPAIQTFDTVEFNTAAGFAVYGPLDYNFNMYKVFQDDDMYCIGGSPGDSSSYDPGANLPPAVDADTLTIATLNAWNFFDTANDPQKDDETGISLAEYDQKSLKLADAVCNSAGLNQPLIVALQEIENAAVLQKLVTDIATTCGASYAYHTLASPDNRGIEVSFLTRTDRVTVVAMNDRQGCSQTNWGVDYETGDHLPDVNCGRGQYYLHNRPPLHLEAQIDLAGSTRTIHLFNNHFKSKLGNSACLQSDCGDWRLEQAQHVAGLVNALLTADPGAYVIVLGDLNDFYNSTVLDALDKTNGNLTNLWDDLNGPPSTGQGTIGRYSYIFNGISETLDHMLVSDTLATINRATSPRHFNADWPASHVIGDNSMFGSSDHDAVVAAFYFGQQAPTATPPPPPTVTPTPSPGPSPTPTPTAPPPTPTGTPTPSPTPTATSTGNTVHIGDLDGSGTRNGAFWNASVEVLVLDNVGSTISGALVQGAWNAGTLPLASCTTDTTGRCTILSGNIDRTVTSVTFTVSGVSHGSYTYDSGANTDPDGDSNGTVITISRP